MTPIQVNIKEDSLLARIAAKKLRAENMAIVFGKTIYLYQVCAEDFLANIPWLRHELKHVEQYQKLGFWGFLGKYLLESFRHGYQNNVLEIEARLAEMDPDILNRFCVAS